MSSRVVIDPSGDLVLQIPISVPTPSKETRRNSVDSAIGSSSPIIPSGQCSPLQEIPNATGKIDDDANNEKESSETRELLVSSKILAVSSPVFRKMLFGGKFVEAIKLADAGDGSTTIVTLPDDDAEAVTLMCKILHFATADINDLPKSDLLERLAAICDKYLCLHILRYCGTIWVRNWVKKCEEDNAGIVDVCRLLVFAYVADMEKEFADIAWTLLLLHKGPLSRSTSDATESLDNPLLPLHIRGKLDAKRMQLCNQYHTALMRPLATWGWRSLTKGCNRGAAP
ncbi:unnamed protein product [Parascedosporium putredinis]|uniref:BTB domain-containing protein n=1 Tax=Parascedosporium putredinis TaxID=1442378 RepID=A0A9P1M8I3_9PEZI|nr:unnamed protein product [Parascedosporium putredinis]CAI7990190.1 unnamed protein product [Parascedosporium putredinis]